MGAIDKIADSIPPTPVALPPDEDELFVNSILPVLRRMPPLVKATFKFKISSLIFEAETNNL